MEQLWQSRALMSPDVVLWIYIAFLFLGGVMGYVKGKSKASLIMALVFGSLLALVASHVIPYPILADILLGMLLVVFGMRLAKTKKFMPSGMLLIITIATLVLRHVWVP